MDNLFNPEYLKKICKKYGLAPSRKYGQNFLINPEPADKMAAAAQISPGDTIVEIGPGFGALTFVLAAKAKKVVAFEIEKKLKPYWEEKIKGNKNIEIVWGNILKQAHSVIRQNYKVVANLPYQITSAVIRHFLEAANKPEMMILMVQKEVGERICARPGDMSVLSVAVQYYAEPSLVAMVPRACFWPEPQVDSAVILIKNIKKGPKEAAKDDFFFKMVRAGFASRRKLLIKNLEALAGKKNREELVKIFAKTGLAATSRAQELSVAQWRQLSTYLSALVVV